MALIKNCANVQISHTKTPYLFLNRNKHYLYNKFVDSATQILSVVRQIVLKRLRIKIKIECCLNTMI